ncbi:response regulator [Asticcacaulis sp. BYS171W]|uniref:Response regulator n=1 Tax=Asticcacaulis aquaticus TaxID=2984212 RepID=A0ABT5HY82_9CAUL|nr:response regulator [Asticcacaulis aquaticus]MDC7684877.1 response regulator [Asticcacaulis aquaticus]
MPTSLYNHLLLADDDPRSAEIARMLLHSFGMAVDVVTNGADAIERLRHRTYDLVLMNIEMPVMDGLEATRRIREAQAAGDIAEVPVIGMSAHTLLGDREKGFAAGMDDYIPKPFTGDTLRRLLTAHLGEI